eukprot:6175306-Pleurochrysis_carterae.AAC.1
MGCLDQDSKAGSKGSGGKRAGGLLEAFPSIYEPIALPSSSSHTEQQATNACSCSDSLPLQPIQVASTPPDGDSRLMDGEASSKQPLEAGRCPGSSPPIFEAGSCAANSFSAAIDAAGWPGTNSTGYVML